MGERLHILGPETWVMGILNVTPDSFADGGRYLDPARALEHAHRMAAHGARIIDVGGASTRPGAEPVAPAEEWRRIGPCLERLAADRPACLLSVDTTSAEVAARALDLGVDIVNDVSALREGSALARRVARSGAGLILMHMRGTPQTMQRDPAYADLFGEIRSYLEAAMERAQEAGVERERIACDPGIGFGKTVDHNLALIAGVQVFDLLERPVLIGASRKRFIGEILDLPVEERLEGSLAAHVAAVLAGAHIVRAHDVGPTVRAVRLADALIDRWQANPA